MKFKLLSIILFLSIGSSYAVSYGKIREDFKSALYVKQQGLMKREAYYAFIEPYLQKAEKVLKIPQYYMSNSNSKLHEEYFNCLLNYNMAIFRKYTYPKAYGVVYDFKASGEKLFNIINEIKNEIQLKDLDVQKEFDMTTKLLEKTNAAYYAKLGLIKKCLFLMDSYSQAILNF
ncbi:hypothetical protein M1446_02700 [Candidatus Dependentiae bacterium]|nr:hypothetical protein [Candidatus Dependentiae bacterium]